MAQGSCFLTGHVQLLVFEMLSESLIFKIVYISCLLRGVAVWYLEGFGHSSIV